MACKKKVCVITGAAGGIGIEVTRKFLENGYHVVMMDLKEECIKKKIHDNNLENEDLSYYAVNITDEESVKKVIAEIEEELGEIDALVNTAGICGKYDMTTNYSFKNFKQVYEVNVFGTFLMIQNVLPIICKQKKGAIVNFGSCSGMRGYTLEVGYGSSKWAVIGMTENIASEYGKYGIRVNSVSPGWVNTEMMKQTLNDYSDLEKENTESSVVYGAIERPAEPKEIADAVYYLCSDNASYITGTNLVVDGGKTII